MSYSRLEQDFIDLFDGKRSAHLSKYVHLYRPEIYDDIVNDSRYYIYKLECEIIKKFADKIMLGVNNIFHVVELGPGSHSPVSSKTLPVLEALRENNIIKQYTAVDITKEYAYDACQTVKNKFEDIKSNAIVTNFVSDIGVEKITDKIIFSFGGTIFCNNNILEINQTINNISNLLKTGEYFIIGVDITDDEQSLSVTYHNQIVHELLLNVMYNLKQELNLENFDASAFDLVFEWQKESKDVVLYLQAQKTQQIILKDREININQGNKYNIINSRKSSLEIAKSVLEKYNIKIQETFILTDEFGNKFALLKTQKA